MAIRTSRSTMPRRPLTLFAPAKINWFLEVLGKRPDGFHELVTFMSQVSLWDGLVFDMNSEGQIDLNIDDPTLDAGESNLVFKAARALAAHSGRNPGVHITLYKRIPREAGLGGGSSDAAATLTGLNRFWDLGYSREQLVELASQLGSDVAFFLGGPSALCFGRGERCQDRPAPQKHWLVMVQPNFGLATGAVYGTLRLTGVVQKVDPFLLAWQEGSTESVGREIFNRLEVPALNLQPQVAFWKRKLKEAGAMASLMTGSGSVIFGLYASAAEACRGANRIAKSAPFRGFDCDPSRTMGSESELRTVRVVHTLTS